MKRIAAILFALLVSLGLSVPPASANSTTSHYCVNTGQWKQTNVYVRADVNSVTARVYTTRVELYPSGRYANVRIGGILKTQYHNQTYTWNRNFPSGTRGNVTVVYNKLGGGTHSCSFTVRL